MRRPKQIFPELLAYVHAKWPPIVIIVNMIPYWCVLGMSLPALPWPHADQSTVSVTGQPLVLVSYQQGGFLLKQRFKSRSISGGISLHHCPFVCSNSVSTLSLLYAGWRAARLKTQQQQGDCADHDRFDRWDAAFIYLYLISTSAKSTRATSKPE